MAASLCLPIIRPYNDSAGSASLFPRVHFVAGFISHAIWRTVCPTISETACAAAGPENGDASGGSTFSVGGETMERPTGVTVISVLNFIGAAFYVLGALGIFMGGAFLAQMTRSSPQGGAGMTAMIAGLGAVLGVVLLIGAGSVPACGDRPLEARQLGPHPRDCSPGAGFVLWAFWPLRRTHEFPCRTTGMAIDCPRHPDLDHRLLV